MDASNISKIILLGFFSSKLCFFFLFCRPYVQVQSEARKEVMKNASKSQAKKGFSYLEGQQTPATQPSNTPWKATLDQNVPGAQSNAEDFTQQFMQDMYGGAQAVSNSSSTSLQAAKQMTQQQQQLTSQQQQLIQEQQQLAQQQQQLTQQQHQLTQQQTVSYYIYLCHFCEN